MAASLARRPRLLPHLFASFFCLDSFSRAKIFNRTSWRWEKNIETLKGRASRPSSVPPAPAAAHLGLQLQVALDQLRVLLREYLALFLVPRLFGGETLLHVEQLPPFPEQTGGVARVLEKLRLPLSGDVVRHGTRGSKNKYCCQNQSFNVCQNVSFLKDRISGRRAVMDSSKPSTEFPALALSRRRHRRDVPGRRCANFCCLAAASARRRSD